MEEMMKALLDRIEKLSADLALAAQDRDKYKQDRDHYKYLFNFKYDEFEDLKKENEALKAEVESGSSAEKGANDNA